ncbi:tol-pal system YbgF family protein [Elusimicrobiota bacterium]
MLVLTLGSCSSENLVSKGDYYFKKGIYLKALSAYKRYLKKAQTRTERSQAHVYIARCLTKLGEKERSRESYEKAARTIMFGKWARIARQEITDIADFFPLTTGTVYEEGDSTTKGRNMYAVANVENHGNTYLIRRKLYAGKRSKKVVRETRSFYAKKPGLVLESEGSPNSKNPTLILSYPLEAGAAWRSSRGKRKAIYRVSKDNMTVKVTAGEFSGCVEISERMIGSTSKTQIFDIYCPGVGRIKRSVGDDKRQTPITELLSVTSN